MSMHTYPLEEAAALLITPQFAAFINSQKWQENGSEDPSSLSEQEFLLKYGNVSDTIDMLNDIDMDGVTWCSEFTGEATILGGDNAEKTISMEDDFLGYIRADKSPSLFTAAYRSMDELINEFREKFDNMGIDIGVFPIEDCVCSISGTYFC